MKFGDLATAEVVWNPERQPERLQLVPASLLGAMWLQVTEAVSEQTTYRQCRQCGTWFALSPLAARTNRLFCSQAWRFRAYRELQERARELHAAGTPVAKIAKALGTDVDTVKRWIALGTRPPKPR